VHLVGFIIRIFHDARSPEHQISHLNYVPPSVNEVKNAWFYTSTPPFFDMTWCLVKLAFP